MKFLSALFKPGLLFAGSFYCSNQTNSDPSYSVFSWGQNTSGQLGLGSDTSRALPTLIEELENQNIKSIHSSGQSNSSVALDVNGHEFTWGSGLDGVLGHSETDANVLIPTPLIQLYDAKLVKVACGRGHMAGLTNDGKLYTWGLDDNGQCGHEENLEQVKNPKAFKPQIFKGGKPPKQVKGELESKKVIEIGCGGHFTAVVTEDGEVYTWGQGRDYALGHGDRTPLKLPRKVQGLEGKKIVKLACGRNFCIVLDNEGKLYSWGNNEYGQLGLSQTDRFRATPQQIKVLSNVVEIATGDFHVMALTDKGNVFSWGAGSDGQLCHGNTSNQSTPRLIQGIPLVSRLSCGGGHSAFITQDFRLLMVGRGRDGQLGRQGNVESVASYRTTTVPVEYFSNYRVLQVSCGSDHSLALGFKTL
mmetsp:Transcript_8694/g.8704  ORF Transcript_8694/g.8704 Transcript_8694/m.8704 type:complete len:417 (+) Transcript_8694:19-1269(+)